MMKNFISRQSKLSTSKLFIWKTVDYKFMFREVFLDRQDKLLISGMPRVQTDALEDMIQKEIPIYNKWVNHNQ